MMRSTRRVSVNFLGDDHVEIAELFASSQIRGEHRFDRTRWIDMRSASVRLVEQNVHEALTVSDRFQVIECEHFFLATNDLN
jgi:flavin reductase (DIM6/NTAB) family NADH-FMN oxidoreductase RutF